MTHLVHFVAKRILICVIFYYFFGRFYLKPLALKRCESVDDFSHHKDWLIMSFLNHFAFVVVNILFILCFTVTYLFSYSDL